MSCDGGVLIIAVLIFEPSSNIILNDILGTMKNELKIGAIKLRRSGYSYSEILKRIPVAKSTLSLWLRSVGLSKKQKQRLTDKKLISARKGAEIRKYKRILSTQKIFQETAKDIKTISNRELWLIGVMLYWAEGSKEKENRPGSGVQFTNSNPDMVKLFLIWLTKICKIKKDDIYFDIFIHENSENLNGVVDYWSTSTKFPVGAFPHIYLKKTK